MERSELIGCTNDKSTISDTFIVDNNKVTDVKVIANGFGSYFSSASKHLAESITRSTNTSEYYMDTRQNKHSLYLNPTDPNEIHRILEKCKHRKLQVMLVLAYHVRMSAY